MKIKFSLNWRRNTIFGDLSHLKAQHITQDGKHTKVEFSLWFHIIISYPIAIVKAPYYKRVCRTDVGVLSFHTKEQWTARFAEKWHNIEKCWNEIFAVLGRCAALVGRRTPEVSHKFQLCTVTFYDFYKGLS